MEKDKERIMTPGILVFIILLVAGFAAFYLFFYNGGIAKYIFGNSYYSAQWTNVDIVNTLISAYSIFITIVLFAIGIPIALLSYSTRKENRDSQREFKEDFKEKREQLDEGICKLKKGFEPLQNEIDENEAFKNVERVYDEDPQQARGSESLLAFSEHFKKKHSQDAQKYFFEAIYLMKDVEDKVININFLKNDERKYKPADLKKIFTAIGYFSMSEGLVFGNNKKNFCRFDIYREMSNAYKSLGLRFFYHNSAIALDYLLKALEYCQKAIYEDDSYMLTYNNKSNILKDIFRLCNLKDNPKNLWEQKLKDKIKTLDLNVFDFKQIGDYINEIYGKEESDNEETAIKYIRGLKNTCAHKEVNCTFCIWNCTKYIRKVDEEDFTSEILLVLIILESIICIEKKVLDKGFDSFKEDKDDQSLNIQRCYYNCAISNYMLLEYSLKKLNADPTTKGYGKLSLDLKENLKNAMEYVKGENKYKKEYEDNIRKDVDLKSLLQPDGSTPDGSTPDGSTPDGSAPDGSTPDGSTPDGNTPDGSTSDGSTPDGSAPDGSAPDGSAPDGSAPDGSAPDGKKSNVNEFLKILRDEIEIIIKDKLKRH